MGGSKCAEHLTLYIFDFSCVWIVFFLRVSEEPVHSIADTWCQVDILHEGEVWKTDLEVMGHTILDLGAEDFTAKAPHPVFDPGLRLKRLRQELEDPQVAVVLLDFITGPGVAYDPISSFARECAKYPGIIFISNICGSLEDPQNVVEKQKLLEEAGVIVTKSNFQSTRLASALMNALERR